MVAVLVHAAILAGFLGLDRRPVGSRETRTLPISWVEPRRPVLAPPSARPAAAAPLPTLPVILSPAPDFTIAPDDSAVSAHLTQLGSYVACGLGQALTLEDRERCDHMRTDLFKDPHRRPSQDGDLALERRFARAKEIEDAPKLLPCFTPVGPDPICFLAGAFGLIALKPGTYAPSGPPEDPLAQPVFPFRPR